MQHIFFIVSLFLTQTLVAQETTPIQYHLEVTDAAHHLAEVSITFPQVTTKTLEVKLPVWRSGRYEILDLSKAISHFSAHDKNGQVIEWFKTDKNTWKLLLKQPGPITISYQVYADTLKQRVIHIDPSHAYLDASGVFMFSPTFRNQPLKVSLAVPDDWQSRSGMDKTATHQFIARNYDQLVDSPIETGIHQYTSFVVEDKTYEIVIWGEGNHDIKDLETQITKLHHAAKTIWDHFPFERYVYIYHAGEGLRGATEHVNSTIIQQQRFNFKPKKSYHKVLATTAHEFVHTWNVKAYRPAGIAPYDYSKENYSKLFWMAEGITSYYDDLMLLRASIYEPEEYHEKLVENIQRHLKNPGRKQKSVAASSFDTWLKQDAQLNHNNSVSIYVEGSMVAWRLDMEIRKLSDNKASLDTLQNRLFQQHSNINQGYNKKDVLDILQDITGHDFTPFWQSHVEGTETIDFDELLAFYGLQRHYDDTEQITAWIGAELDLSQSFITIKTVDNHSPAWQAGLNAGDQILAIDGLKVSSNDLAKRIENMNPEQSYLIHYFSAGQLQSTTLKPKQNPYPAFKIVSIDKPSRKQKASYKDWTGKDLAR